MLECTISEVEFLGSETQIGLQHDGISGLSVTVPGVSKKCVGEQLHIKFNKKDLHFFNEAGDNVASY